MTTRTLILAKGGRKYVFRYTPGCEGPVLDQIRRLAEDPQTDLDWLDAATLSFQVACQATFDPVDLVRELHEAGR